MSKVSTGALPFNTRNRPSMTRDKLTANTHTWFDRHSDKQDIESPSPNLLKLRYFRAFYFNCWQARLIRLLTPTRTDNKWLWYKSKSSLQWFFVSTRKWKPENGWKLRKDVVSKTTQRADGLSNDKKCHQNHTRTTYHAAHSDVTIAYCALAWTDLSLTTPVT